MPIMDTIKEESKMARLGRISEKLRLQALERDSYHCVYEFCDQGNLDVHHVQWLSEGGTHELANLATLCKNHHDKVHRYKNSERHVKIQIAINMAARKAETRSYKYPRRIMLINDPDLEASLKLYQSEFPGDANDSPDDIKRWISEATELRKRVEWLLEQRDNMTELRMSDIPNYFLLPEDVFDIKRHIRALKKLAGSPHEYKQYIKENIQETEEYIWIHKRRRKLCGFLYYEYHYGSQLAYIDYLVSKNVDATYEMLGKCLLNQIKKEHPECEGIIAEMEDPTSEQIIDREKARARLRLFCNKWGLQVFEGAAYRQPKLDLSEESKEIPMFLAYYPLQSLKSNKIGKRYFKKILGMLLDSIYGSSFETQDCYEQYMEYLSEVKERILSESCYPLKLTKLS